MRVQSVEHLPFFRSISIVSAALGNRVSPDHRTPELSSQSVCDAIRFVHILSNVEKMCRACY